MISDGDMLVVNGYEAKEYKDLHETLGNEEFWMSKLSPAGYEGQGHILVLNAEEFEPGLGEYGAYRGIGATKISEKFTEALYNLFGKNADPKTLSYILASPQVPFANTANMNK